MTKQANALKKVFLTSFSRVLRGFGLALKVQTNGKHWCKEICFKFESICGDKAQLP